MVNEITNQSIILNYILLKYVLIGRWAANLNMYFMTDYIHTLVVPSRELFIYTMNGKQKSSIIAVIQSFSESPMIGIKSRLSILLLNILEPVVVRLCEIRQFKEHERYFLRK